MSKPIFILTDFGTRDPYVGIMKAVITKINPISPVIDLTHDIPPGDIRSGAVILWQSLTYMPEGSVILSVIDPGVGTPRLPILLESGGYTFIGPDNGTFTYILKGKFEARELSNPDYSLPNIGATFHGRDIFAPAAAHTASGVPSHRFGPQLKDIVRIPLPRLSLSDRDHLEGEVLHLDRFGNALTSLGLFEIQEHGTYILRPWIGDCSQIRINMNQAYVELPGKVNLRYASTFSEIPKDACKFIIGSSGVIEIAANRQSAADLLNLKLEDPVNLFTKKKMNNRRLP